MTKENKTEIKKMVITIEGKDVVLSIEGAKKLKNALNDLFGSKVVENHYHGRYGWWWDNDPQIIPCKPWYTVTCGGTQTGNVVDNSTVCLTVDNQNV